MQVRAAGISGVAQLADHLALPHLVAGLDRNAARLQMRVDRPDARRNLKGYMVSAVIPRSTQPGRRGVRRLLGHPVERHGDHVGAEAVPLLVPAAVALEQSAVAQLHPVDGELLEILDAVAAQRDSRAPVRRLGYAARFGVQPGLTLERRRDGGRLPRIDVEFRANDVAGSHY